MAKKQKKNEVSYTRTVWLGIGLVFLWIFDRILYPANNWDIIRIASYIVMIVILVIMIKDFITLTKSSRK